MSAYDASQIRGDKIRGIIPPNRERRKEERAAKEAKTSRWTFDRLWTAYQEGRPDMKRSPTDASNYQNHLSPVFGDKEPREILPLDVDRLRLKLAKKKKPATVRNILELLRRLSNFAEKKHLAPGMSFKLSMPNVSNEKTEDLSRDQMTRLLEVLRTGIVKDKDGKETELDQDAREMMLLALLTGMRRGEIFRLKWEDVDRRGFITLKESKGGTDQKIPITEAARKLLVSRPRLEGCPYVFPGRGGGPKADASKHFRAIRKAAKLPADFRPMHGLRHTFASHLASSGEVDLYTLQKILTHKSPTMTQRYAHLTDAALKRGADVMSRIVKEAEETK